MEIIEQQRQIERALGNIQGSMSAVKDVDVTDVVFGAVNTISVATDVIYEEVKNEVEHLQKCLEAMADEYKKTLKAMEEEKRTLHKITPEGYYPAYKCEACGNVTVVEDECLAPKKCPNCGKGNAN